MSYEISLILFLAFRWILSLLLLFSIRLTVLASRHSRYTCLTVASLIAQRHFCTLGRLQRLGDHILGKYDLLDYAACPFFESGAAQLI